MLELYIRTCYRDGYIGVIDGCLNILMIYL